MVNKDENIIRYTYDEGRFAIWENEGPVEKWNSTAVMLGGLRIQIISVTHIAQMRATRKCDILRVPAK